MKSEFFHHVLPAVVDTSAAAAKASESRAALQPRGVRHSLSHRVLPGEKTLHNLLFGEVI